MRHVGIDPQARTATVEGGARWSAVLSAASEHGLAPLLGSSPGIGVVGYTVGGGFGWLGRRHGLAVDRVRSATIVLADGTVVVATAETQPDLFWALLGAGGGSLGIVVELTFELVKVRDVYAGNLLYPADAAADVFAFWRTWIDGLPPELTSSFLLMCFPPLDAVPAPLRGQTFAIVRGCHCGELRDGAALVDAWRTWRPPAMDLWGPMPFSEMATISQDPVDPLPAATYGRWLASVDDGLLDAMRGAVAGGAIFAEVRHGGEGAVGRPNPQVGYAARDGAAEAFPDAVLRRLGHLKRRFDPDDLFAHGVRLTDA